MIPALVSGLLQAVKIDRLDNALSLDSFGST